MIVDRIGFGQGGSQLPVDEEGKEDIIMWMDHRQFTVIVNIMVIVNVIIISVVISCRYIKGKMSR